MAGGDVCSSESFNEDIAVFSKQVRIKERRKEGKKSNLDKIPELCWLERSPRPPPAPVRPSYVVVALVSRSVVRHLVSESKVDEGLITRREGGGKEGERWKQQ